MDPQNTPQPELVQTGPEIVKKLPKAAAIFKQAFQDYKKNLVLIIGLFAAPLVFSLLQTLKILPTLRSFWSFVGGVLTYIATLGVLYALTKSDKKETVQSAFQAALPYFFPAIWIGILTTLALMGGLVLFVIPGIIIGLLLTFSLYTLFVDDKRGMQALIKSWHHMKGYWLPVVGKLLFLGIIMLGIFAVITVFSMPFGHASIDPVTGKSELTLPVASLVIIQLFSLLFATPLSLIYYLILYKSLVVMKAEASAEEVASIRKKLKIFIIIGIVAAAALLAVVVTTAIAVANGWIVVNAAFQTAAAFSSVNPFLNLIN